MNTDWWPDVSTTDPEGAWQVTDAISRAQAEERAAEYWDDVPVVRISALPADDRLYFPDIPLASDDPSTPRGIVGWAGEGDSEGQTQPQESVFKSIGMGDLRRMERDSGTADSAGSYKPPTSKGSPFLDSLSSSVGRTIDRLTDTVGRYSAAALDQSLWNNPPALGELYGWGPTTAARRQPNTTGGGISGMLNRLFPSLSGAGPMAMMLPLLVIVAVGFVGFKILGKGR